jgi:hypothetical protein
MIEQSHKQLAYRLTTSALLAQFFAYTILFLTSAAVGQITPNEGHAPDIIGEGIQAILRTAPQHEWHGQLTKTTPVDDETFFWGAHLGLTIQDCLAYYQKIGESRSSGTATHQPGRRQWSSAPLPSINAVCRFISTEVTTESCRSLMGSARHSRGIHFRCHCHWKPPLVTW